MSIGPNWVCRLGVDVALSSARIGARHEEVLGAGRSIPYASAGPCSSTNSRAKRVPIWPATRIDTSFPGVIGQIEILRAQAPNGMPFGIGAGHARVVTRLETATKLIVRNCS